MRAVPRRLFLVGGLAGAVAALAPHGAGARAATPQLGPTVEFTNTLPGTTINPVAQPAIPRDPDTAYIAPAPAYTALYFDGYRIARTLQTPRIEVRPTAEFAAYGLDAPLASLTALLRDRPTLAAERTLPFLPPVNARQIFHAQEAYLDTGNGSGVRYLTTFSQNVNAIPDNGMFYTAQTITGDGAYYVAAVFPVLAGRLPIYDPHTGDDAYTRYVAQVREQLIATDPETMQPPLSQLDALMRSVTIT